MKLTIDLSDFRDEFRRYGRADQFSCDGLAALFEYLEEVDPDYEFDVIGLCCDYYEDTVTEIARNYSINLNDADPEDDDYEEQCTAIVRDYLSNNTTVVGKTADGFVYAAF